MDLKPTINKISLLCQKRGITINKMLEECNLTKSVVDNMKKIPPSIPSVDKIMAIADYFNVPIDYLVDIRIGEDLSNTIYELSTELSMSYNQLRDFFINPIVEMDKKILNKENLRGFFVESIQKSQKNNPLFVENNELLKMFNELTEERRSDVLKIIKCLKE